MFSYHRTLILLQRRFQTNPVHLKEVSDNDINSHFTPQGYGLKEVEDGTFIVQQKPL